MLHTSTTMLIKGALLFKPNVVVTASRSTWGVRRVRTFGALQADLKVRLYMPR
jgi:hypothetical protein